MAIGGGRDVPRAVTLAEQVIPVDPERIAQLLGDALRVRHEQDPERLPQLGLDAVVERIGGLLGSDDADTELTEGPYLGRTRRWLLDAAMLVIDELPPARQQSAPVRFPFTLADCAVEPDGTLRLAPPTHCGDRHLDLAALAVGLADRFGPAIVGPLFERYGMDGVDARRLDAAQLVLAAYPPVPGGSAP
jgi:hypothetical protein